MVFPVENIKIALLCASMYVTYHIKLFRTGADRKNGFLMSLLIILAETKRTLKKHRTVNDFHERSYLPY